MTNRQNLMRRAYRTAGGIIATSLVVGILQDYAPQLFALRFTASVLLTAAFVAAVWVLFEIPCLNCRKSWGKTGFWVASGQMGDKSPRCPHCEISVDADVPTVRKD
jgi:hypothetical protein